MGVGLANALLLLALETILLVPSPLVATSLHFSHQCDCYEVIFPPLSLETLKESGLVWENLECGRQAGRQDSRARASFTVFSFPWFVL